MAVSLQSDLFGAVPSSPVERIPGLSYIPDTITPAQEAELIAVIDRQPWLTDLKRRVQHYGYRYDYTARRVDASMRLGDIPEWLQHYCDMLHDKGLFPYIPDQVIINEYQPGQGIAPHTDCIPCFEETIASISLGSPCVMEFTHGKTAEKVSILLEPRSMFILSGDARYYWKHSIPDRKTDRYEGQAIPRSRRISLTFRKVIAEK